MASRRLQCTFAFSVSLAGCLLTQSAIAFQDAPRKSEDASLDWPQWRGPNRDNISLEKGLLKEWPDSGPPLEWRLEGLGQGIASVSIAGGRIYTTTYKHGMELLVCLDQQTGKLAWATPIGEAVPENPLMRWLSQRSPTLDGDRLYVLSAQGDVVCVSTDNGEEHWRKNYIADFDGRRGIWGFCDYPLVDGHRLICRPGGATATVVALDKHTGETIWKFGAGGEQANSHGDHSAMLAASVHGIRQYIGLCDASPLGLAADDGRLLWTHGTTGGTTNALTPNLLEGEMLLYASRPFRQPAWTLLKLAEDRGAIIVDEAYANISARLDNFQDNIVCLGDHAYTLSRGIASCYNWKSGKYVWQARVTPLRARSERPPIGRLRRFASTSDGNAATIYADGRLYARYSGGRVTLIEPLPQGYIEKGGFDLPDVEPTMGATTPVIAGGRLYLRDDDRIFAYDIRRDALEAPPHEPSTVTIELPEGPFRVTEREGDQQSRFGPLSVFVPTPHDVVSKMLELAEVTSEDLVYDLGSGDGRIVIAAAKNYGSRAVGVERDAELVETSRAKAAEAGVEDLVTIEQQDIFQTDLSDADVVALYLLPKQLATLLPQLSKLPDGARIVSHQFEIPGVEPDNVFRIRSNEDAAEHRVYLWRAPLRP